MKVVDIEAHREVWIPARCLCVLCSYMWDGVVHEDRQIKLECPECGEMKGAAIQNFEKKNESID